jgi:hypothetical protein
VFRRWHAAGENIAGRPASIGFDANAVSVEHRHNAWGLKPRADVYVGADRNGEAFVVELKLAGSETSEPKYEPLGIAEVLFHAECLTTPSRVIRPILVTQYNLWNRLAIARLNGVAGCDVLAYYEVSVVDVDGHACFWFDAPLVAWRPLSDPPVFLVEHAKSLASWLGDSVSWFEVPETVGIVATTTTHDAARPTIVETPYLMAAPMGDDSGRYLVWAGTPPARNARKKAWAHDHYWIAKPS